MARHPSVAAPGLCYASGLGLVINQIFAGEVSVT